MRTVLIMLATAAVFIAAWVATTPSAGQRNPGDTLSAGIASEPGGQGAGATSRPPTIGMTALPAPMIVDTLAIDRLHKEHGILGTAMMEILRATIGQPRDGVERLQITSRIATIMSNWKSGDAAYLAEVFRNTPDPTFRWWFDWIANAVKDDGLSACVAETFAIDPHRALETLATIGKPIAVARLMGLLDAQSDHETRLFGIAALGNSAWDGRVAWLTGLSADEHLKLVDRAQAMFVLGHNGQDDESRRVLSDVAFGPPQPIPDAGSLARDLPVADLRAAAISALMLRGDAAAARRLIDVADQPGAEPAFVTMVDAQLAAYRGPDIDELIFARIARRGVASAGEVYLLARDSTHVDRPRLTNILPLVRDPEARATVQRLLNQD